jgi:zona occludens toxin (predicted ATPase)
MSFDGRAIVTGVLGVTVDKVIDELAELTPLVELKNTEEHA